MPWSGAGTFSRIYSWVADAAAGIDITASRMDADTDNIIVAGFNNCLTRDGQGSATANQPMNGFHHINVADAALATQYVTLKQLQPGGTLPGVVNLAAGLGDIKQTALVEALLPALAKGWYICAGQTRPRTDPLWLATGAVNAAYWLFGNGDGTTTYTLPDYRGRLALGKDDMGGSAASRVTNAISGVTAATLGGSGGDQRTQQHLHTATAVDSGHTHPGGDTGHIHTASDSGHTHTFTPVTDGGTGSLAGGRTGSPAANQTTNVSMANITVAVGAAAVLVYSSTANVGVTVANSQAGGSQNMPPVLVSNFIIYCGV